MERMTRDMPHREGHEFRYHMAAGFLKLGDTVLDAACGTGYGAEILDAHKDISYYGADKHLSNLEVAQDCAYTLYRCDLEHWTPEFPYDVFIGFETIEHLGDYTNYIKIAKQARRTILLSVPVIPTKHMNPYHLHDFEPGALPALIEDADWRLFQGIGQPSEFSEIYVFQRRGV